MPKNSLDENFSEEEINRLRNILEKDNESFKAELKPTSAAKKRVPQWVWIILAIAVTIALAFFYVRVIDPWITSVKAQNELTNQITQSAVIAENSEMIPWTPDASHTGEIPEGVNPAQLALGVNDIAEESSVFIFSSENASDDSHVLELYMDFYSQRSRDFITVNKSTLESMIGSGRLILKVYPVLNKESFSIYAPEALAEAFGTAPDKAWQFFTDLLKESITLEGSEDAETVVKFIANNAIENIGCDLNKPEYCIDEASIVNATFLTWLYTSVDDPRLSVGYTPPVIYIDGKELDQTIWPINDPDKMLELFTGLS